jgi:DNA-binding XRE family transcriptional regulator
MKKITLDSIINEELHKNPAFAACYQKELLINELSKMLIALRKRANLTQMELAQKAKTTQPVIARLESGADSRIPSLQLLIRIASASNAKLHISFE